MIVMQEALYYLIRDNVIIQGGIVVIMGMMLLPTLMRYTVWSFYKHYPKDSHFYSHQTYARRLSTYKIQGLFVLFISILIAYDAFGINIIYTDKQFIILPLCFLLIWIFCCDFHLYLIPFTPLIILFLLGLLFEGQQLYWLCEYSYANSCQWQLLLRQRGQDLVLCMALLWGTYFLTRKGIGQGDIYFLSVLTLFFAVKVWLILILVACVLGLIHLLVLRLLGYKKPFIPFAPWICTSAWCLFLVG